jgi:hypothetical protein
MKRWGYLLLAAVAVTTAVACTPDQVGQVLSVIRPAQVAGQGGVTGNVLDQQTQKPVADAKLTVGTQKATSDGSGVYSVPGLSAGTLFMRVDAAGYQPFFGEVQIAAGTTRFDVPLKPLTAASPSPIPSVTPSLPASDLTASPTPVPTPTPVPPLASPVPSAPSSDGVASPASGSAAVATPVPQVTPSTPDD